MRYLLVTPEIVDLLNEDGESIQQWTTEVVFEDLVLAGAPLFRDEDNWLVVDLALHDDGSVVVNTNDPDTGEMVGLPLSHAPRGWPDET